MDTLDMHTNEDIQTLLDLFVDSPHMFDPSQCEATTGMSGVGWWEEGDIDYLVGNERHTLSYDYMTLDDSWTKGRVFRYTTY
jgi:hypothetical protein